MYSSWVIIVTWDMHSHRGEWECSNRWQGWTHENHNKL